MDDKAVKNAIGVILKEIGENPNREGLKETPSRMVKMFKEVFSNVAVPNSDIANLYGKTFPSQDSDMVCVKNISVFSYCEHHMSLIYNMHISVAYIPNGKVLGLSKIPRICEAVCKRLQLQEQIGLDVLDVLERVLKTKDIIVKVEAEHSCMVTRGVKSTGALTVSYASGGVFKSSSQMFNRFQATLKDS